MTRFIIQGPFNVPTKDNKASKAITTTERDQFWENIDDSSLEKAKGCYVFAIRAAKGYRPLYVGKATKSFKQEVFQPHKISKYMEGLSDTNKGTPVLFFVTHPVSKGKVNGSHIDDLETFLIQTGILANKNLLNDRKTKQEPWSIAGILRDGRGKPTNGAVEFKKVFNL